LHGIQERRRLGASVDNLAMSETAIQDDLLKRLALLERRVLSLEGKVYHNGAVARAVREVVSKWPGPFTANQIREAVYELQPDLRPPRELNQVHVIVGRMEKAGEVICVTRGAGPTPNIYERASCPPARAGKSGSRLGVKAGNESGFRSIVRGALEELPAEFTVADLRAWMSKRCPEARIPYGSWSSTLYKMQKQKELIVVRNAGCSIGLKVYGRGPRRISSTGAELRELEESWREFRAQIKIPDAEMETPLQRGNVAD
jgi:hypothetical protein